MFDVDAIHRNLLAMSMEESFRRVREGMRRLHEQKSPTGLPLGEDFRQMMMKVKDAANKLQQTWKRGSAVITSVDSLSEEAGSLSLAMDMHGSTFDNAVSHAHAILHPHRCRTESARVSMLWRIFGTVCCVVFLCVASTLCMCLRSSQRSISKPKFN